MTLIFFVSPISKRIFYFYLLPALSVKGSCGKLIQTFSEGVSGIAPPLPLPVPFWRLPDTETEPIYTQLFPGMSMAALHPLVT